MMKTYLIKSDTNYGLMVHVVNANTEDEAIKLASNRQLDGGGAWPGCEAVEIDTKTFGVVAYC